MSKEPTALEELIDNEITDLYHEGKYDYDTYSRLHDWLSEIVKEEKEQREEREQKIAIESYLMALKATNYTPDLVPIDECRNDAETYYKMVIKGSDLSKI